MVSSDVGLCGLTVQSQVRGLICCALLKLESSAECWFVKLVLFRSRTLVVMTDKSAVSGIGMCGTIFQVRFGFGSVLIKTAGSVRFRFGFEKKPPVRFGFFVDHS